MYIESYFITHCYKGLNGWSIKSKLLLDKEEKKDEEGKRNKNVTSLLELIYVYAFANFDLKKEEVTDEGDLIFRLLWMYLYNESYILIYG